MEGMGILRMGILGMGILGMAILVGNGYTGGKWEYWMGILNGRNTERLGESGTRPD
jgi:hypothetical protein